MDTTLTDDFIFESTDFDSIDVNLSQKIASLASRILKEKLERAPEVFDHSNGHNRRWHTNDLKPPQFLTHKARLICIEEIK